MTDLHIHDTDLVTYLFGKPRAVSSSGLVRQGRVDSIRTIYDYARLSPLLSAEAGWINAPSLQFEHGYDAFFEDATCHFNSSHAPRPVLFARRGRRELRLAARDGFQNELQAAVEAVRRGRAPKSLSATAALLSLTVCRAEERSVRCGKKVRI